MQANDTMLKPLPAAEEEPNSVVVIAFEILTLIILCITGILGNILVCLVIYRSRRIQSTTNFFVFSLAIVDLVYAILSTPFMAGKVIGNYWMFGAVMCKLVRFLQVTSIGMVMYLLSSIAIDRYYTIIYPLSFKVTRGTSKRMIAVTTVIGIVSSGPSFYFYDTTSVTVGNTTKITCPVFLDPRVHTGLGFTLAFFLVHFLVPLCMLLILYIRIFKFIWRINFRYFLIQRTINHVPKAKVKMVKMLIIVTVGTVLCFLPLCVLSLWVCLARPSYVGNNVTTLCIWLVLIATLYKPLVYTCMNSNFRRGSKEVFCMSSSRCYRSNTYAITTASTFGKKNHIGIMRENSQRIVNESPSKAFDRSLQNEKTFWPLPSDGIPTTYV